MAGYNLLLQLKIIGMDLASSDVRLDRCWIPINRKQICGGYSAFLANKLSIESMLRRGKRLILAGEAVEAGEGAESSGFEACHDFVNWQRQPGYILFESAKRLIPLAPVKCECLNRVFCKISLGPFSHFGFSGIWRSESRGG